MQEPAIDYSRKWYVMLAVGVGIFLATLDGSIVNVAMPTLERTLQTSLAIVQWVVLAYLLTVTTLLLSIGRLADIIGKKSIYLTGFMVFTLGSLLCGLSPTVAWLIAARVLQAVGAAMIMALGPAIITEAFPTSQRGQAMGLSGLAVSLGIITGPMLGGLLLRSLSWHWIFLVNVPVGIVATLISLGCVPATKPRGKQRFDYVGAITMFISLLALLLGLTFGQELGFTATPILALLGVWLLFLALFLTAELRSDQPMVDLRLFRNTEFSISLITGFITFVLIAGVMFLTPFYLENVLGYDPLTMGQLLSVLPIALGVMAPMAGWLSDRFGTRSITIIGLCVQVIGYGLFSRIHAQTTMLEFVLYLLPVGLGMGIFQSPNNSAIMGTVPQNQLGIASGFLAITRTLGQTTGIALLSALWASRVDFYTPGALSEGTTSAPIAAQVAGLHDSLLVAVGCITLGLLLSIWGAMRHRRVGDVLTDAGERSIPVGTEGEIQPAIVLSSEVPASFAGSFQINQQRWHQLTHELVAGMHDWCQQHPQATQRDIEAELDTRWQVTRARMIQEIGETQVAVNAPQMRVPKTPAPIEYLDDLRPGH